MRMKLVTLFRLPTPVDALLENKSSLNLDVYIYLLLKLETYSTIDSKFDLNFDYRMTLVVMIFGNLIMMESLGKLLIRNH